MTNLTHEMTQAWLQRADAARADLEAFQTGWELFKPEFMQKRHDDYIAAIQWANFWAGQQVSA